MDTHSGKATLSKLFCLFETRSTLKGKNLLPRGANSFLLELTSFQKGLCVPKNKHDVTKVVSLVKAHRVVSPLEGIGSKFKVSIV